MLSRQKACHLTAHFLLSVAAIAVSTAAEATVAFTVASGSTPGSTPGSTLGSALFERRKAAEQLVKLFSREAATWMGKSN